MHTLVFSSEDNSNRMCALAAGSPKEFLPHSFSVLRPSHRTGLQKYRVRSLTLHTLARVHVLATL